MQSNNPVLKPRTFAELHAASGAEVMTIQGTVNRALILLLLCFSAAAFVWMQVMAGDPRGMIYAIVGFVGGIIFSLVTIFKKDWAGLTAPVYALFEGLVLGGISAIFEKTYPGIAFQAIGLTFGVAAVMFVGYRTGIIPRSQKLYMGIAAATGAIMLFYLASMVMGFFGVHMNALHDSSPLGIGISVVIVVVAALNLVLDFNLIENGAEQGAPKYMEWYGAFALMVTLVWLYLEILRLLSKLNRRR